MGWLIRWLKRHPEMQDYLEGAGMVWYAEPPARPYQKSPVTDAIALISDMAMVGSDLRIAMKRMDKHVAKHS